MLVECFQSNSFIGIQDVIGSRIFWSWFPKGSKIIPKGGDIDLLHVFVDTPLCFCDGLFDIQLQ
jgi:hypothetical protein